MPGDSVDQYLDAYELGQLTPDLEDIDTEEDYDD